MKPIVLCRGMFSFFVLFVFLWNSSIAQQKDEKKRTYKLRSGTELSEEQVDSLRNEYDDELTYSYQIEKKGMVITVFLPGEDGGNVTMQRNGSRQEFIRTPPDKSSSESKTTLNLDDYKKVYRGLDGENLIDEKTFKALLKTNQYQMRYSISFESKEIVYSLQPKEEYEKEKSDAYGAFRKKWENTLLPEWNFQTLDGASFSQNDLRGKIVVINFWFIRCRPCLNEMPELNTLVEKFKGNEEVVFLAPALDNAEELESFQKMEHAILNHMKEDRREQLTQGFSYQVIPAADEYAKIMEIPAYPTHIVVDRKGIIQHLEIGAVENIASILTIQIEKLIK